MLSLRCGAARFSSTAAHLAILSSLSVTACNTGSFDPPEAPPEPSRGMAAWRPGPTDTCPVAVHDRYSVVGPDGKLYPTWHPPVDLSTGCTFGHEHGRDPTGSTLFAGTGAIPFGYANEQLDLYDPTGPRHEDHVGHKVEWENGMVMRVDGFPIGVQCDVLTKLHQGTHSKDAFANNLHEIVYHLRCTDGNELHVTLMSAIGRPGEFARSCDRAALVAVGPATPANSPVGGGKRVISDRGCVDQFVLVPAGQSSQFNTGLRESWQTSNSVRRADGRTLAHFNPYFQVLAPSRYYDAARQDLVGRTVDLCYETDANGERARGGGCVLLPAELSALPFDDVRSPFNGVDRFVDINANRIANAAGPEVWYTDPFGRHGATAPFRGSIKQFIAKLDNTAIPFTGPAIGNNRSYGGVGVHAPN